MRRTGGGLGPGERGKGYSRRRGGLLPIRTFSLAHSRTDLAHVQRGGVWVPAAFDRRRDARERAPPDKASKVEISAILLVYYWYTTGAQTIKTCRRWRIGLPLLPPPHLRESTSYVSLRATSVYELRQSRFYG